MVTDPVLVDRLFHLRRYGVTPRPEARSADLILLSHLHGDHIHLRSLRQYPRDLPVVAPHGALRLLRRLGLEDVRTVAPGDVVEVAGATIEVLPATHDDRRSPLSQLRGPALGFRVEAGERSFWFPGDTGLRDDMADVRPVDLALVPVGGWGPTLGPLHMDPDEGAVAVARVGARWALPVHWGTFWPVALSKITPLDTRRCSPPPARGSPTRCGRTLPGSRRWPSGTGSGWGWSEAGSRRIAGEPAIPALLGRCNALEAHEVRPPWGAWDL